MRNILWITLILLSCNSKRTSNTEPTKNADSTEELVVDKLQGPSEDVDKNDQPELSNAIKSFSIDTCSSPAGLVIEAFGPSDIEGVLYFYRDNRILRKYYDYEILIGNWVLRDSIVDITYNKRIYKKGIGEPVPLKGGVPGNYIEQYNSYERIIEEIEKDDWYHWNDIKNSIKESDDYYILISYELDENSFDSNTQLKL